MRFRNLLLAGAAFVCLLAVYSCSEPKPGRRSGEEAGQGTARKPGAQPIEKTGDQAVAKPGPAASLDVTYAGIKSPRKRLVKRTLVFPRIQPKYGLYENYLRRWLDRPLMQDSSLREWIEKKNHAMKYPSFVQAMKLVRQYDLDGLAFIIGLRYKLDLYKFSDRAKVEGFHILTEFSRYDGKKIRHEFLEAALKSKSAIRVNGKLLITAYRGDGLKPAEWQEILGDLRARHGDTFLYLPDIVWPAGQGWSFWAQQFAPQGALPAETRGKLKSYLRSYLDVCDGIYFSGSGMLRTKAGKFDVKFYREFIIPLYQEVLAEPRYRHKYFGLSAGIGHFSVGIGSNHSEDGTKRLRHSFEVALSGNPDVIVMPEWNEVNENTFIQPTVYNSFSTQRIIKYYMRQLKGLPLVPNPGDDTTIPNLIISYRKFLCLGEKIKIELLNVPDSEQESQYTVTLALKDINGKVVRSFPPATFAAAALRDKTFVVPSEEFAEHLLLVPALTIETAAGRKLVIEDGLHYIRLRATWNWDYKWVKQPLRDLCRPRQAALAFTGEPDPETGERTVAGAFAGDEDIASVEVLENDDVVYAVDREDEFLRNTDNLLFFVEFRSLRKNWLKGSIAIKGANGKWLRDAFTLHRRELSPPVAGQVLQINYRVNWYLGDTCRFLSIPAADIENAVLHFDLDKLKTVVPLKRVVANGIYSEAHDDGLTVTVSRYYKQPDIPVHLNRKEVDFSVRVSPEMKTSVFHLRVIMKSGKTYRSRPLMLPQKETGDAVDVPIYSSTRKKPLTVKIARNRVPDIKYDFTDKYGAILHTAAGRPFFGHLGGYIDTAAGRGGGETGMSGTPFRAGKRHYPENAKKTAPQWVTEDGVQCLKFDGIGNYALLPIETLPRRTGFKLSFEIKPTSLKPQVLFAHHGYYIGSLVVKLDQGKLSGSYCDRYLVAHKLNPGLSLELGKWSKVEILYDLEKIVFRVNGKESPPLSCPGPGLYISMSIFGGFGTGGKEVDFVGNTGWFEGYLKSLRIVHTPY